MPKGMVEIEPGRLVHATSKEYKAWLVEHPEARKPRRDVRRVQDAPEDFTVFEPPPPPSEHPAPLPAEPTEPTREKRVREKSVSSKSDDYDDIVHLTQSIYAGAASLTGDAVWLLSESEAHNIARPLNNILKRNPVYNKMVRQIADPVALFAAVAFPTSVRFALWQSHVKAAKGEIAAAARAAPVKDVTRVGEDMPPSPPPANGRMEDVLSRISMA